MRRLRKRWPALIFGLATLAPAASPATAGEDGAMEHEKVLIKTYVDDCEGEDCGDGRHHRRVIVVGDDGEVHRVEGDATTWIGHGGAHRLSLLHPGKGGFLGVATTELTPELRRYFGVPEEAGVLVARVVDDSAAALAGVQVGDILTAVGGSTVVSTGDLVHAVRGLEPGSAVDLEVWRDGTLQTLAATLGERQWPGPHTMVVHCGGEGDDCPEIAALESLSCAGDPGCKIEIVCADDGCKCAVNGEATECETLPGFAAPGE
jgi:hypothetical protein